MSENVNTVKDLNNEFKIICGLKKQKEDMYQCEGNILNVSNYSDEKEIQNNCDQSVNSGVNCIIKLLIRLDLGKKIIHFQAIHENLKEIIVHSIVLYGFLGKGKIDNKQELYEIKQGEYESSINIVFNKENKLSLERKNEIFIKF